MKFQTKFSALQQSKPYLLSLLYNLEYVEQSAKFHPEGDALYHSLQVFELAYHGSDDAELWLAALLHDVGKAIDYPNHDWVGSQAILGCVSERVCWLVRHHLDLLKTPKKTRSRLKNSKALQDLEKLRRWDLAGRSEFAQVMEPEQAFHLILNNRH